MHDSARPGIEVSKRLPIKTLDDRSSTSVVQQQASGGKLASGSTADARSLRTFFALMAQLLALLLVIHQFEIESEAFFRLSVLTVAGFAVHYFLPLPHRLPFFVVLSLAGIGLVLGLAQGLWLVVLGLSLIGIAYLRVSWLTRAALLLAVGIALAIPRWTLPRWGVGQMPWSSAIWPILGSMFVFRLIAYMYDRKHETTPPRLSQTLAYFFLLPNVCFPLFPVVDFKKFCRNYYDVDRHRIYQVGIEWMWRGLVQLVLYRLIYFHLTIDTVAVDNLGDLVVYVLSTFLLYVRISGQFHLVVGMLHLFGFNLPETHNRYLLASSFTDFWRRINIYWKDFMLKVFYYPAFFSLRKLGDTRALVLATAIVFFATWVLHMAQWFWIRGSILFEWNDIIFWSVLAGLVMVNSVYESRHGRARTLGRQARTFGDSVSLVLRTAGTFTTICLLWSLWSAESVSDWLLMMSKGLTLPPWTPAQFAAAATALVIGAVGTVYAVWKGWGAEKPGNVPHVAPWAVFATSVLLCLVTTPAVTGEIGTTGPVLESLRAQSLNRRDAEQFQRGYYENLVDLRKFNDDELWRILERIPNDRSLLTLGLARSTNDRQGYEMIPLARGVFAGAEVNLNRWGMRDKDYSQTRPAGTYRIALVGPSLAMGSGVRDDEGFEVKLEERLNGQNGETPPPYEILNFGVAGYSPLHVMYQLERKVFAFEPTAILYLGHSGEVDSATQRWAAMIANEVEPGHPFLDDLARRTGVGPRTGSVEARRRLRPYRQELLAWIYRRIVDESRARGVQPVFMYMPTVMEATEAWRLADRSEVLAIAREAGFIVLDLSGAYEGHPFDTLWIRPNDGHPNALGNQLIADRLYERFQENAQQLGLPNPISQ